MVYFNEFSVKNQWYEVESKGGTAPPSLQEHTVVSWKSKLYVFGGEIGFASTGETPLWVFDICKYFSLFLAFINRLLLLLLMFNLLFIYNNLLMFSMFVVISYSEWCMA